MSADYIRPHNLKTESMSKRPVYRKVTHQIIRGEYFPALQNVSNLQWNRDTADYIARNIKFAIQAQKDFENRRLALLRSYTEVDARGNIEQVQFPDPNPQAQGRMITKPKFRSEQAEVDYITKLQEMDQRELINLKVVLVDKRRMPNTEIQPIMIAMLEPMWMETDEDEVEEPEDPQMNVVRDESDAQREPSVPITTRSNAATEQRTERELVRDQEEGDAEQIPDIRV